ncbi:hypothetical protein [Vallitalea okinawensis]|uniref:hypothetical protein n=1 Tax=Vallitalea okinawensis TaxID=2078660 RepID=UPI000CFC95D3|nr:hypothetical protein [Vallitalea okinawensis]
MDKNDRLSTISVGAMIGGLLVASYSPVWVNKIILFMVVFFFLTLAIVSFRKKIFKIGIIFFIMAIMFILIGLFTNLI